MSLAPELVDILNEEASLYEELLALLADEERALLQGNTRAVSEGVPRKEALALKIRLVELSRQATVGRITGHSHARLGSLPVATDGELGSARARLADILPKVETANRRVEVLLLRSLARLHNALDMIQDAVGGSRRYGAAGQLIGTRGATVQGRA